MSRVVGAFGIVIGMALAAATGLGHRVSPGPLLAFQENAAQAPKGELPAPALHWDDRAEERARRGAPPLMFIPEWLEAADRLCEEPELGSDAQAIANWEPERLKSVLLWLQWIQARALRPGRNWFIPNPGRLALLHTAAVMSQVAARHRPEFRHLAVAEALLSPLMGPGSVDPGLRRSWFAVTPQWMLAYDRQDYAVKRTEVGLTRVSG